MLTVYLDSVWLLLNRKVKKDICLCRADIKWICYHCCFAGVLIGFEHMQLGQVGWNKSRLTTFYLRNKVILYFELLLSSAVEPV